VVHGLQELAVVLRPQSEALRRCQQMRKHFELTLFVGSAIWFCSRSSSGACGWVLDRCRQFI
jgi:hypothetical protein